AGFTGAGFTSNGSGTITVAGGNLTIANIGAVTVGGAISDTTGSVAITGGTALTNTASIGGQTGLNLSAGSLLIGGALSVAGTGNASLTATASTITLNAGLTVASGSGTFASATATTVNGAVNITGGALGFTGVGFTSAAAGTLSVGGGNFTIANTGTVTVRGTVSNTTGSASVTGATTLTTTAGITGQTGVTLSADTVTIGGTVTATTGTAALTTTAGALTLNAGVTTLAGGATFASGTGGSFVNGPVSVTGGDATFTGGGLTSTAPGTITVAGGDLTIANSGTVAIGGALHTTTGSIGITGATILNVNATITAASGLTLAAGTLAINSAVILNNGALGFSTTVGDLAINASVTTLNGAATLSSAGATLVNAPISVTGGALAIRGVGFTSTAPGTLTVLTAHALTIANTGTVEISGAINDALGAVAITGATTLATTATITGGTGVTISAGGITLGAGVTASAGSVGIVGTAGDIASNAAVTATTGDVTLDARGAIVLNGAITSIAGGTITLNAGTTAGTAADRITQTAAGILGGTGGGTTNLVVAGRSLDASATLTQGNRLVTVDALTGGTLAVTSTGALSVARANSAGSGGATSSVSLTAASLSLAGTVNATTLGSVTLNTLAGSITQRVTGIITAATLSGSATGVVALATANNLVASTGAFTLGGDFSLLSTLGLTVASPLRTPGNAILLTANSLAIQGALTAGTVTLAATAGAISQANAGIITTPSLTATATAGVNLNAGDAAASQTTAWNQVTTLVSGTGGTGGFTLRNSRDLNVSGTVTAGTGQVLRLDATGTPVLGATSALSAPSGTIVIAASGPVELRGALTAGLTTITSATGPVTQTTGTITGRLAVRAIGAVDIQNPGNAITNLSANAVGGRVDVVSATAMTVVTATNVALHGGTTTTIAGVTGTTVFLTGPGLTLNAATTATTGDVQLRADTMAIAGGVNATAGEVRIEQLTLGATPRGISLGAEVAGSLSLTTSELAAINTPTLIIGRSTGVGAAAIAGQITLSGAISVPGSVTDTLRLLGSGIAINGSLNATGTAVTELRALTQSITSASGGVSGQTLIATSPFGSVTMSALNDFANVTGSSSVGGTFAYHDANGFQIIAPGITGAAVSLIAETGNITQAAGAPIVTGSLFALARNGSALLDGGGVDLNQIGSLAGGGAGVAGVFRLSNASGFTISGTLDNGAGGALGTAQLFTPNGSIIQTGGIIRANRLEITLPAGSASFGSGNAIATLGTTSIAGDLTLVNAGSLTLAGPVDVGTAAGGAASTTSLTLLSGSLTQGAGARLRADILAISALGGDVLLTAGGSNSANDLAHVGTLAGVSAGGAVNLRFGTPIFVAGLLSAGSGAGALTLEAPGITIGAPGQGGTLIRGGSVVLRAQAGFDGPGGFPTGSIIQQGGAIEAINLAASAPGGNIMLDLVANRFTALAGGVSADGSGSSQSLVAGGTIDVTEGGAGFTVQAGIASGGLTRLTASNALTFNVATTLSGPIALTAGGLLTIPSGGQLNSGSTVSLSGGNGILVQGSVSGGIVNATTGGVFNLSGGSASAAMGAPGAINVTAGALQTSGGSFSAHTILLAANSGGADINGTTFNATGLVSVTATGNINVNGPVVNANAAQFRTSSFLALSGGNYTLGRVVVFAGAAGITTSSPTTVRPRNAGTFPGIVVDTRQSLVGFDPLTIVQADIVGVPVNDQPTQVRTPNADLPGAFGPSSNAPAGTAQIRLDALQSPVFLLLDGGSFSGVFNTSGRVGVHGRGGGSQASGVLVDPFGRRLEGQATASLADATRPATGGEIARFRVNDCVISSFNCVAPTQVIVIPVTVPSIPPLVFGVGGRDPDAVSPNVAEEWSVREDDE
ncbi:MAG: filamentous hemagglutinin N-terminal protein, partial [Rhodospirillales bacterium]|nr:filamentous hemagglutinin N-terminal protein [Rhodospirillales bacterium]